MKKIIELENIVKSYGAGEENRNVIDGVTAVINEGEFVAIMGPSGSGKSTMLFAMSGMEGIDSGTVLFDGKELSKQKEQELAELRRTQMGFVFQQSTMLKNLNILDNIILSAVSSKRKGIAAITTKAKKLMKKVGISELCNRDITQVSGGQLQRGGICRALMAEPKIIFGDEPTGALNSKSAEEIMDIFTQINEDGTAILIVTHDVKVAARAERIMFMYDGKIVNEMQFEKTKDEEVETKIAKITAKMDEIGI